jgi:hypothetical protein
MTRVTFPLYLLRATRLSCMLASKVYKLSFELPAQAAPVVPDNHTKSQKQVLTRDIKTVEAPVKPTSQNEGGSNQQLSTEWHPYSRLRGPTRCKFC